MQSLSRTVFAIWQSL